MGAEVRGQCLIHDLTAFLQRQQSEAGEMAEANFFLNVPSVAASVDCSLLPGHPYRRLLRRLGFLPRGTRGVFYVHRLAEAGLPADIAAWDVNYLDSDW